MYVSSVQDSGLTSCDTAQYTLKGSQLVGAENDPQTCNKGLAHRSINTHHSWVHLMISSLLTMIFIHTIKAICAKILTVAGVYNLLERPLDATQTLANNPYRVVLGGGKPEIISECS